MSLQTLSRDFVDAFQASKYDRAVDLLPQIKLACAQAGLLKPVKGQFQKEDLLAARQLLEMGVLALIHADSSSDEITRLITQLRPFYSPALELPRSENESKVLALHLLLLLTTKEIAEFHTELETLENIDLDKYLKYPVALERWLMEGAYDKAWQAVTEQSQFPAPEFAIMTLSLQSAIRNEIALCSEKAYTSLPVANARHLLFLASDADLNKFANARGWTVSSSRVTFPSAVAEDTEVATDEGLISNLIDYGSQIETII